MLPALSATLLAAVAFAAPGVATTELLRTEADGRRVYVIAHLPDGAPALFLVDTGADVTVLSADVARRLGLHIQADAGTVSGLSHQATVSLARLDTLRLGTSTLSDVEVVVGLPGGLGPPGLPVDGLLGNNVWSRYVVELDYGAGRLRLHPPSRRVSGRAAPLRFDGHHATTPVVLHPVDGAPFAAVLAVDTGADDVVLFGAIDAPADGWTTGVELMPGVAGDDDLPLTAWLRATRRLDLRAVDLGGARVERELIARHLEEGVPDELGVQGLIGHGALDQRRVLLDYQGGRFAVRPGGHGPPRDVWQALLDADAAHYGDVPERLLARAWLHLGAGAPNAAWDDLQRLLDSSDRDAAALHEVARVLSASIQRSRGDLSEAWRVLAPLTGARLVDLGELPAVVAGLLLEGHAPEAEDVAENALRARPDAPASWIARSDLLLHNGDPDGAWSALQEAVRLSGVHDAWPLRRARVALATGDRIAAQALLREALFANPLDGKLYWFYAQISDDADTARADLTAAASRVHPASRPTDFLVGAWTELGDRTQAAALAEAGIAADCAEREPTDRDNCTAWYLALAETRLDEALRLAQSSVATHPLRSDYLDTLATTHLARGEWDEARRSALAALRLAPADAYLRWQLDRVERVITDAEEEAMIPTLILPLLLAAPSGPLPTTGRVVKVYDGDTYTLESGDKIRLSLVNTPELKPAEPYGDEARQLADRWLMGKEVQLQVSPEGRDGYGRVLASVRTDEGPVALALLESGLGHLFIIPPETTDLTPYYEAQERARAAGRGIWTLDGFRAGMHITSFHANGSGDDVADPTSEYFRICNTSPGPVDLSTWSIRTRAGLELKLPKVMVPAGWTVKVMSGKGPNATDPRNPLSVHLGTDGPVYDDDYDVLQLLSPEGHVVEERPSKAH